MQKPRHLYSLLQTEPKKPLQFFCTPDLFHWKLKFGFKDNEEGGGKTVSTWFLREMAKVYVVVKDNPILILLGRYKKSLLRSHRDLNSGYWIQSPMS